MVDRFVGLGGVRERQAVILPALAHGVLPLSALYTDYLHLALVLPFPHYVIEILKHRELAQAVTACGVKEHNHGFAPAQLLGGDFPAVIHGYIEIGTFVPYSERPCVTVIIVDT